MRVLPRMDPEPLISYLPCGDDSPAGISAFSAFILTGDEGQRIRISICDPFQSRGIIFGNLFVRIDYESGKLTGWFEDEDAVIDFQLPQHGKRTGFHGVEVVVSRDHSPAFTRQCRPFQQSGSISQPGYFVFPVYRRYMNDFSLH